MKKYFAITFVAICALSVSAQDEKGAKKPSGGFAQYSGGGIRGAVAQLPDGWLVSAEEAREFQGEEGFNQTPAVRARAVIPLIDILKPEPAADLKVKAPFAIAVHFKGQNDTPIDPSTFKVLYGAFKVDITSRITKFVNVTSEGFALDKAQIPVGKHRLTLQVQDEKQRMAERELRIEVVE
jgi:hypothetical protein